MAYVNEKISKDIKYIGKDFPTIRKNLLILLKLTILQLLMILMKHLLE